MTENVFRPSRICLVLNKAGFGTRDFDETNKHAVVDTGTEVLSSDGLSLTIDYPDSGWYLTGDFPLGVDYKTTNEKVLLAAGVRPVEGFETPETVFGFYEPLDILNWLTNSMCYSLDSRGTYMAWLKSCIKYHPFFADYSAAACHHIEQYQHVIMGLQTELPGKFTY